MVSDQINALGIIDANVVLVFLCSNNPIMNQKS